MLLHIAFFIAGFVLLYFGAEGLVRGAAGLAKLFGIRPIIVGLTVVAFGTSMPEFMVCFVAAIRGSDAISLGNIIGSNIANIGLVLGIGAIIFPMAVSMNTLRKEMPMMLLATLLLLFFSRNGWLGHIEGIILFAGIVGFTLFCLRTALHDYRVEINTRRIRRSALSRTPGEKPPGEPGEKPPGDPDAGVERKAGTESVGKSAPPPHGESERPEDIKTSRVFWLLFLVIAGSAGLFGGAELLVRAAIFMADAFGISQRVIGLSMVAVGTSLPELATSIVSAVKREADICVGNVVGSNLFNILFCLGGVTMIRPIRMNFQELLPDFIFMLIFSFGLYPLMRTGLRVSRIEGIALFICYGFFIFYIFYFR
jgi:cation:H+ antiporter